MLLFENMVIESPEYQTIEAFKSKINMPITTIAGQANLFVYNYCKTKNLNTNFVLHMFMMQKLNS